MQTPIISSVKISQLNRPGLEISLPADTVHLWQIELDIEDRSPQVPWQVLDETEKQRALRLRNALDQKRFIYTHGLLRFILSWYLDRDPCNFDFSCNQFGKPSLDSISGFEFNISHSGNLVLFAFTPSGSIGVDVEHLLALDEIDELESWCLSVSEKELLRSLPPNAKTEAFYKFWVVKEAYVKMLGRGLTDHLDAYNMAPTLSGAVKDWSLEVFTPLSGYLAALAVKSSAKNIVRFEGMASYFIN